MIQEEGGGDYFPQTSQGYYTPQQEGGVDSGDTGLAYYQQYDDNHQIQLYHQQIQQQYADNSTYMQQQQQQLQQQQQQQQQLQQQQQQLMQQQTRQQDLKSHHSRVAEGKLEIIYTVKKHLFYIMFELEVSVHCALFTVCVILIYIFSITFCNVTGNPC